MNQGTLFDEPATVASPICCYQRQPCWKKGRAVLGPVERSSDDCENRSITCLTCGATGTQSTNLKAKAKGTSK